MKSQTKYVALKPDSKGIVPYSNKDNETWRILYERQMKIVEGRACREFLLGLERLKLNNTRVPQCVEVSAALHDYTGWRVQPVEALISFEVFFALLSRRVFPAASFIRTRDELDYLKEPDIFHELFGHCPLLTNHEFAGFTHEVGRFGVTLDKAERAMLARLYWFTVEFGLIEHQDGLRIYGGGILSSKEESVYALESSEVRREAFDLVTVLRTPYRYDELQKTYFVIQSFEQLFDLFKTDLKTAFAKARQLGMLKAPENMKNLDDVRSC